VADITTEDALVLPPFYRRRRGQSSQPHGIFDGQALFAFSDLVFSA
jgi:hypothetical protein